jgi:hypothetical protein
VKKFNWFVSLLIIGLLLDGSTDAQTSPIVYARDAFIVEEYPIKRDDLFDPTSPYMRKREKWRASPSKKKHDGWGNLGPAYMNNELIWCEVTFAGDTAHMVNLAHWKGLVRNSKKVLYEFSFEYGAGGMPVRFGAGEGYWLLQMEDGRVILNGEDLRKKYGYAGMWGYRFFKGKPFYFFSHKGDQKIKISYDGKEIPNLWYNFVGDNGGWTAFGNEVMVWFGAVRGNQWYYVEAGVYE